MSSVDSPGLYPVEPDPSYWSLIKTIIIAVNYSDPPIIILIIFHIISSVLILHFRSHIIINSAHFLTLILLIFWSSKINNFFMANYMSFGFSDCYFDEIGFFIFIYWTIPLSFQCTLLIIILIVDILKQFFIDRYANHDLK